MDLFDRLTMLVVGGCLGYVLARIVDYLRDIKKEVDEIHNAETCRFRDEDGITRLRTVVMDLVLLAVVLMVVYATWVSVQTSKEQENNVTCNGEFLSKTITALNDRTTLSSNMTKANVEVQRAQADFFLGIYEHPANDKLELELYMAYSEALRSFLVASDTFANVQENPYPTVEDFESCLNRD